MGELRSGEFRPEIQALRAVAVALVVVFHVWPDRLPGGFVGIDVFFVISGFLIVGHLHREAIRTGAIDLRAFWRRRIARLLPGAAIVLAACTVFLLTTMPPTTWGMNLTQIAASAAYVQNWVVAAQETDYFRSGLPDSLVQHFWTLSVEEQFYIVWPLLLVAALLAARRAAARRGIGFVVLVVLGSVTAISFVASVWQTAVAPEFAYFATTTRAWEFGLGGLLAVFGARGLPAPPPWAARAASWTGLALIVASALMLEGDDGVPGAIVLAPVAGALLVIWAGPSTDRWSPNSLAVFGPVQFLGDISYSLYLWHWPLLVAFPYVAGRAHDRVTGIALIAVAVLLAWATTAVVERPVRSWGFRGRSMWAFATAAAIVVLFVLTGVAGRGILASQQQQWAGADPSFSSVEEVQEGIDRTLAASTWAVTDVSPEDSDRADFMNQCVLGVDVADPIEKCTLSGSSADRVAIVMGDSFALHLIPGIQAALGPSWRVVSFSINQCPFANIPVVRDSQRTAWTLCAEHRERGIEAIQDARPDLLVVSDSSGNSVGRGFPSTNLTEEQKRHAYVEGVRETLSELSDSGIPTLVVTGPLRFSCSSMSPLSAHPDRCVPGASAQRAAQLERDKRAVALGAGASVLALDQVLCDEDLVCPNQNGHYLISVDQAHLEVTFSRMLGPIFRDAIDAALTEGRSQPATSATP